MRRPRGIATVNRSAASPTVIIVLCGLALLCGGCTTGQAPEKSAWPDFWEPHLLYLQRAPCDRLYVEIDAVEGTEPEDATVEALRAMLQRWCDKPGGVEVVRHDLLPRDEARDVSLPVLDLRLMDGPPEEAESAAYLHILFYDHRLLPKPVLGGEAYGHVLVLPYPATVYIDRGNLKTSWLGLANRFEKWLLFHEVGHALGLVRSPEHLHSDASHCRHASCIMYGHSGVATFFSRAFSLQWSTPDEKEFCRECRDDLATMRDGPPDEKLRFVGPVLVRSEGQYHVLALPNDVTVYFGPLDTVSWSEVLGYARRNAPAAAAQGASYGRIIVNERFGTVDELATAVEGAKADPYPFVRWLAEKNGEKLLAAFKEILPLEPSAPARTGSDAK